MWPVLVPVIVFVLYAAYRWVWLPWFAERLTFQGDSSALRQTIIVPTLDSPLKHGENAIWCATFQSAWQQLGAVSKGILLQPPTLIGAEAITTRLNHSAIPFREMENKDFIPQASLYKLKRYCAIYLIFA